MSLLKAVILSQFRIFPIASEDILFSFWIIVSCCCAIIICCSAIFTCCCLICASCLFNFVWSCLIWASWFLILASICSILAFCFSSEALRSWISACCWVYFFSTSKIWFWRIKKIFLIYSEILTSKFDRDLSLLFRLFC